MEGDHVLVIPYPGRGHINPLMNLCKLMAANRPKLVVTFVVTEEWLSFLISESKPSNIHLKSIPNVIPSEKGRSKDFLGFLQAVYTKMEAPVESLLDRLGLPEPNVIMSDSFLPWVVRLGERRNIPVASFWPMSATVFSVFYHHQLLLANGHLLPNLPEQGEEVVTYIPGITSMRVKDLPTANKGTLSFLDKAISLSTKAQCMLFTTMEALECKVIEALKAEFPVPIYTVGLTIPYFIQKQLPIPDYFAWLDDQPKDSVLYISQGSFLSVSKVEMDEIIAGVHSSGVRFFWVARDDNVPMFEGGVVGKRGVVVPWCDQLKVLCHPSVGGFWSHCGWNSTKEGVFAGTPFLTSPIIADQHNNSKQIVEDWKIGWRLNNQSDSLVKREEIAILLRRFMDSDCYEVGEMRRRAMGMKNICQQAIKVGTFERNIDDFIYNIFKAPTSVHIS